MESFLRAIGTAWNGFWFFIGSMFVITGVVMTIGTLIGGYDHEWYVGPFAILLGAWIGGYSRIYDALTTTGQSKRVRTPLRTGFESGGRAMDRIRQQYPEQYLVGVRLADALVEQFIERGSPFPFPQKRADVEAFVDRVAPGAVYASIQMLANKPGSEPVPKEVMALSKRGCERE